ncbi:hypothetical protein FHW58_001078 [Duganella sp. 1224]|uniref:hypothetical protein n=1 Tax=Duganella sp. 1224 TaxID=2587052 RepID=UPI0015C7A291|nr:hypothetical protein [Duganella sp. 1224]NYE59926.1 hypothetical protein [Duganella sp. 1224]
MIECTVHSDVEDMRGKRVLVFLRPQAPQLDYQVHAWQQLEISSGATVQFQFDPTVGARIVSGPRHNRIWSAEKAVAPGQLLRIVRRDLLAPTLEEAPTGMALQRLMPQQYGVYNETYPYTSVSCVWQVSGKPVVTMPNLDWGMTCTFCYEPVLYFMIAAPMLSGENFSALAFTDMKAYKLLPGLSTLDVTVRRDQGRWMFSFISDLDEQFE